MKDKVKLEYIIKQLNNIKEELFAKEVELQHQRQIIEKTIKMLEDK